MDLIYDIACDRLIQQLRDEQLTKKEKIALIATIKVQQQERWKKLKRYHNLKNTPQNVKHHMMKYTIALMRDQKFRLEALEFSINH